ncbi:hypothetical protein KFK09_027581 [Dendrobium nobile]|uniref:Uncharacterized protein n=1 Tax=Dendrobium nobile TaxID=94219 RepID=A0A8T3AGE2_DENNO|nr:hypothetical protein KFK09_027581 [Dendrobium nobile]
MVEVPSTSSFSSSSSIIVYCRGENAPVPVFLRSMTTRAFPSIQDGARQKTDRFEKDSRRGTIEGTNGVQIYGWGYTEMRMLRWMIDFTLIDMIRNEHIRQNVGIAPVEDKIRGSFLRWFGYIKRQSSDDLFDKQRRINVDYKITSHIGIEPYSRSSLHYRANPTDIKIGFDANKERNGAGHNRFRVPRVITVYLQCHLAAKLPVDCRALLVAFCSNFDFPPLGGTYERPRLAVGAAPGSHPTTSTKGVLGAVFRFTTNIEVGF